MQQSNTREMLINSAMDSLKIDKNPFNYATIEEFISHIQDVDLRKFYGKLFGNEHSYLNGMDRIAKVAESFKVSSDSDITERAKKLISFTETQNTEIGKLAIARGEDFNNLVRTLKPAPKYNKTFAVLDNVKPYYNAKELIINIRHYQTSSDALKAFIEAIEKTDNNETLAIDNRVSKLIGR